jgi:glycosyltransferase involved in cell wall biosynthesis
MSAQPLVSVYLPTRNRASVLLRAIASVLDQDYPRFELLVVDDASTDETPRLLERMAASDPRVRCFRNPVPRGASAARNVAIREARGEFLTGLDDDDLMLRGRLTSLLRSYSDSYSFVCSSRYVVNESARWFRLSSRVRHEIGLQELLTFNSVGNQGLMRTERVREVGAFDEAMPAWQDYDLWTRMVVRYGPALRIADPTYVFFHGRDPQQITNSDAVIDGARLYLERYASRMGPCELKGQRLMQVTVQRKRLTLRDAVSCCCGRTWRHVAGYWLRSNLPWSEGPADAYRRWRWPLESLPARVGRQVP